MRSGGAAAAIVPPRSVQRSAEGRPYIVDRAAQGAAQEAGGRGRGRRPHRTSHPPAALRRPTITLVKPFVVDTSFLALNLMLAQM
jgi:hypothetical protein